MKPEIKRLRKCQQIMNDNTYPGYPFQLSIVVDCKTDEAWVGVENEARPFVSTINDLSACLLFQALNCNCTQKGNWLHDTQMTNDYINCPQEDYYIDNIEAVRFYFAVNQAYRNTRGTDTYIFACVDNDADYVDCKVFNNLEEIDKYVKEYWEGEENE